MSKHRTVCNVGIRKVGYHGKPYVYVTDEDYVWYEVPAEVLKKQLMDLIFYPMEQKDKRYRRRVGGFGYKQEEREYRPGGKSKLSH